LQNELIGDFYNEFSTMPERPEDLALQDLGTAATAADPEVKLGKTSSALIAKLMSSKMPARFNDQSIRNYLAEKWGLGPLRQTSILLFALASEPPSRIPSVEAAERYWDDISSKYAESCGITLQVRLDAPGEKASATQVDSAVLVELSKGYRNWIPGQPSSPRTS
jgi:fatty acid synthase subunit alpha, fungi type